jgi:hypothetical protein
MLSNIRQGSVGVSTFDEHVGNKDRANLRNTEVNCEFSRGWRIFQTAASPERCAPPFCDVP